MIKSLIKAAADLDRAGFYVEADLMDKIMQKVAENLSDDEEESAEVPDEDDSEEEEDESGDDAFGFIGGDDSEEEEEPIRFSCLREWLAKIKRSEQFSNTGSLILRTK